VTPEPGDGEGTARCRIVDTETGEACGLRVTCLEERNGRLIAYHPTLYLDEAYQRRGLGRALMHHCQREYPALGIRAIRIHARDAGALIWGRLGFDFDLADVEGPDEGRRRARSVAAIFSPDASRPTRRRLLPPWPERGLNPYHALRAREKQGPADALAAAEMWRRIPSEDQIERGELEGTFTNPAEIVAFEAHDIPIGADAMRYAHWDGIMYLGT